MRALTLDPERGRALDLARGTKEPLNILVLGAHSDDIEIGCGGSLLRLLDEHPQSAVRWVVIGGDERRAEEARASAEDVLGSETRREIICGNFRDGFFPYQGSEIKEFFEELKSDFIPDLIFTHRCDDAHQDHRLIAELTWNTFPTT